MALYKHYAIVGVLAAWWFLWGILEGRIHILLFILGTLVSFMSGVIAYFSMRIYFSKEIKRDCKTPVSALRMQEYICDLMSRKRKKNMEDDHGNISPIISRNIDQAVNELIEFVSRDFVFAWFGHLMSSEEEAKVTLKKDIWQVIKKISQRLANVDHVKLLAIDVVKKVTEHFEKIRLIQTAAQTNEGIGKQLQEFPISPHLISQERECEYLSKVADYIMIVLFPPDYSQCIPIRHILKEVFARHVLLPAIDKVTNPEYINTKVLAYIKQNQSIRELSEKTFTYADSYEDFITLISSTNDPNEVKQIRYNILTEIMQATTLDNLRKAKGKRYEEEELLKEEPVSPRHMKRYISQLIHAKEVCEKRLAELGFYTYSKDTSTSLASSASSTHHGLTFEAVMSYAFSRRFFSNYLEEEHQQQSLMGFWSAVEELRRADRTKWHQIATEIFYCYINKSTSVFLRSNKASLKKIEAFLLGDGSPEIFYELQEKVEVTLKETYFPAFLLSEKCTQMLEEAAKNGVNLSTFQDSKSGSPDGVMEITTSPEIEFKGHSSLAKSHLEQISEKLQNKLQAMEALKSSLKPDSRVLTMLQKEVEGLEQQKNDVTLHLTRTDSWANHLGKWKCRVHSVEHVEGDKDAPLKAKLTVFVPVELQDPLNEAATWICSKSVSDFHSLHRKLVPYVSWVKSLDLPSQSKSIFLRNSNNTASALEKSRHLLQNFMESVMADEQLNQSELLYDFLSPGPPHLKAIQMSPRAKSNFLPFSNFFKGEVASGEKREEASEDGDDDRLWLDDFDSGIMRGSTSSVMADQAGRGDVIAESLYALIGEVFDMRGVFKWIRKSLMTFVQITYGSTINRQIRDTVDYLISEQMILYYLNSFKKSLWSNGKLKTKAKEKATKAEMAHISAETKELLIQNMPEVLNNLVGQQAAVIGTIKVFETFQNVTLNKQLFYDSLELCLQELFPELHEKSEPAFLAKTM